MIDFEKELDTLLTREETPLAKTVSAELESSETRFLAALNKKQSDISIQIEEIYDIVSDLDTNTQKEALEEEHNRLNRLLGSTLSLCDVLEDFRVFAEDGGDTELANQAAMMWKNALKALERCDIKQIKGSGVPFDLKTHTALGAAASDLPKEYVVKVVQSGYSYKGEVIRKASVILSEGEKNE